jgi:hypothetical protein
MPGISVPSSIRACTSSTSTPSYSAVCHRAGPSTSAQDNTPQAVQRRMMEAPVEEPASYSSLDTSGLKEAGHGELGFSLSFQACRMQPPCAATKHWNKARFPRHSQRLEPRWSGRAHRQCQINRDEASKRSNFSRVKCAYLGAQHATWSMLPACCACAAQPPPAPHRMWVACT